MVFAYLRIQLLLEGCVCIICYYVELIFTTEHNVMKSSVKLGTETIASYLMIDATIMILFKYNFYLAFGHFPIIAEL